MFGLHHPRALAWLTGSYALFMIAFGSILASLVLYQIEALELPSDDAYDIFAASMALLWIFPLGGGYISTQLGYVNSARVGLFICALGLAAFCIHTSFMLNIGLSLFVIGNALATPAIWCMVDHCYSKTNILREAGFTLFYLFFNVGAALGIFLGGVIAKQFGFSAEFGLGSLCLIGALFLLHLTKHKITPHPGRTILPQVSWSQRSIHGCLIGVSLVALPITMFLLKNPTLSNELMFCLLTIATVMLLSIASRQKTVHAKNKVYAFTFLSLISIAFWTLYSIEPSFLSVYIENNVDKNLGGFYIPASSFFAFDSIFVVLLGLLFSRIWIILNHKKINPSLPFKFSTALLVIGCGFCFLGLAARSMGDAPMPALYIICTYALFAFAELLVGPLGIAMVGNLAPEGKEGFMMGFWQLAAGIGGALSGYIAIAVPVPSAATSCIASNEMYGEAFLLVGLAGALAGCAILLFAKKLRHLTKP